MRNLGIPDFITKGISEVNDLEDAKMREKILLFNKYMLFLILRGDERPPKKNNK